MLQRDQETAVRLMVAFGGALDRLRPLAELAQAEFNAGLPSPYDMKINGEWVRKSAFQLARYDILERQLIAEINALAAQTGAAVRGAEADAIGWGQEAALEMVRAAAANPVELAGSFARVPDDAVRDLVGTLHPDSATGRILESFGADAAAAMRAELTSALALGVNPRAVAAAMERAVGISATRALTISRTEMLRAYRTSTLARFGANDDIVQGWRWVAAHNTRTCLACLANDGREFPLTVAFFPGHPNCRCASSPVLKPEYRRPRAALESGAAWFDRQPVEVRRAMLPKALDDDYAAGEIRLADFAVRDTHPTWGDSYREATIAEARANAARRRRRAP